MREAFFGASRILGFRFYLLFFLWLDGLCRAAVFAALSILFRCLTGLLIRTIGYGRSILGASLAATFRANILTLPVAFRCLVAGLGVIASFCLVAGLCILTCFSFVAGFDLVASFCILAIACLNTLGLCLAIIHLLGGGFLCAYRASHRHCHGESHYQFSHSLYLL